ncbi:MAG: hypothetical protein M3N35_13220 [Candidatus Binatota bacterium]|nr:hypothetical protein [Candidatus Binatota bacterium]
MFRIADEWWAARGMRKLIVTIACAGWVGSATAELVEVRLAPGTIVERRLTMAPGKFAELCSDLQRGQTVSWQFRANAAMDFNIHYHVDKHVEYPEQRKNVKDASGNLVIEVDQGYCWMWTNRSATQVAVDVTLREIGR